ncbi:MAG: putative thiol-disulfide oxidoreductase [Ilumatobacteraceae bacterium]|nr:putative thiol-disulfide oxidoreductase [Ilumatobacteraceae bacterium]
MAVNRRLLAASIGAAVVVSVGVGWAISRGDDGQIKADDSVQYSVPVVEQFPSIGTNAELSGKQLPDVTVQDNDGNDVPLRSLIGTPLVINFWYSTCGPCKTELKGFGVVHGELGDKIRFVGINPDDTPETNVKFAADRGVHYELLRDPDGAYSSGIGIATAPVTIFVSADGTIVRQTGVLTEDELRQDATELLG